MAVNRKAVQMTVTTKGIRKPCKHVFKSAFKAISNRNQIVGTTSIPQVLFGKEIFDLGNEYNPDTSTFIPKRCGTYRLFTSIVFNRTTRETFDVNLLVTVNDIVSDITGTATVSSESVLITASGVLRLRSGDNVQVFVASNVDGIIKKGVRTQFLFFVKSFIVLDLQPLEQLKTDSDTYTLDHKETERKIDFWKGM